MVSDFPRFHTEVSHLTDILRKNTFLIKLVDNCIKSFFNKKFLHFPVALTVEKRTIVYCSIISFVIYPLQKKHVYKKVSTKISLFVRSRLQVHGTS